MELIAKLKTFIKLKKSTMFCFLNLLKRNNSSIPYKRQKRKHKVVFGFYFILRIYIYSCSISHKKKI